jgi:hypothetical protein
MQALTRKYRKLKLDKSSNLSVHRMHKMMLALPLIPKEEIFNAFELIVMKFECEDSKLYLDYFRKTWLLNLKPETFCVYGLESRTNNESECLNGRMKSDMANRSKIFYSFIGMLYFYSLYIRTINFVISKIKLIFCISTVFHRFSKRSRVYLFS